MSLKYGCLLLSLFLMIGCSADQPRPSADSNEGSESPPPAAEVTPTPETDLETEKEAPEVPEAPRYTFGEESAALAKAAGCARMKKSAASGSFGALAGCIEGSAETAKLFINGAVGSNRVENVKVMWNDWFLDRGYGLHPDRKEARRLLKAVVERYAPNRFGEIEEAFFQRQALSLEEGEFEITVRHDKGPAIDEHLLTITFPGS